LDAEDWRSARVVAVRLTDGAQAGNRFVSGERAVVEVDYDVVEPVVPVVSLVLETTDGALVAGTDNRLDLEPDGLPPGLRSARFEIDALPLHEGRFSVSVSLDPAGGGSSFHRVEHAVDFTVFAQTRGYGIVSLPGRWSLEVGAPRAAESPAPR
jgi:hypothetical protein